MSAGLDDLTSRACTRSSAFVVGDDAPDLRGKRRTASARYTALLRTVASSRIVTRNASKKTTGYIRSSGRLCQTVTSTTIASVTAHHGRLIQDFSRNGRQHLGPRFSDFGLRGIESPHAMPHTNLGHSRRFNHHFNRQSFNRQSFNRQSFNRQSFNRQSSNRQSCNQQSSIVNPAIDNRQSPSIVTRRSAILQSAVGNRQSAINEPAVSASGGRVVC